MSDLAITPVTPPQTFLDRVSRRPWGEGPWDTEPDRVEWRDAATGLPCLIRRGPLGAWCGYVAVSPEHPWHGKGYGECLLGCPDDEDGVSCWDHYPDVSVHGGLTFASRCMPEPGAGEEEQGICHLALPGESDDVWWFGFDCGHFQDLVPGMGDLFEGLPGALTLTYRDQAYVTTEVTRLARQLAAVAT